MRIRQFLLASTALCISIVVSLVLGESILRLMGVQSTLVYRPSPLYGWGHTPGNSFEWKTGDAVEHISINALGLRDYDYQYVKAKNIHRTLVLGDSFSEGLQVPLEERFSNLIADELNSASSIKYLRREVINAGVSGYGTDNELLFFRHEGYKYNPDLVVLALYVGNDVRNNWYPLENVDTGGFRKPYFELVADKLELREFPFQKHASFGTQAKMFLNEHLVLYSFLRETRNRIRHGSAQKGIDSGIKDIPLDLQLYESDLGQEWVNAFNVTNALLGELKTEVNAQGARLLVVLIPSHFQVYPAHWQKEIEEQPGLQKYQWNLNQPNQILANILSANSIDYFDLLPVLRVAAEREDKDLYIVGDGHWNAAGHVEAAKLISQRIEADYLNAALD